MLVMWIISERSSRFQFDNKAYLKLSKNSTKEWEKLEAFFHEVDEFIITAHMSI